MLTSFCLCTNKSKEKFREVVCYKNETIFKEFEGTIIGQCINCGLLKTFPAKKNKLFEPKTSREKMYETAAQKFIRLFGPMVEKIKKFKGKGRVLDVGCSSGLLLSLLKKGGFDIVGVEPNKTAYQRVAEKYGDRVFNGTLVDYSVKNKKQFDCIIYNHVLEHIERVDKELIVVKKLLKKDGILVVGVPNTQNMIFFLRKKYWEMLMPNEHVWHFHARYLIDYFNRFGFKTVDRSFSDDKRQDYSLIKRLYFQFLSLVNKLFNTGENVVLVMGLREQK